MAKPVKLENKKAFEEALEDYEMSSHARQVLRDAKLVVLSGIAGGGRNTVIKYLVEHHNYFFLVSDTTRPAKMRDGAMEQDGVNYHFRSESDVLDDIKAGEYVEAEVIHNQQVSGTSIREMERANQSGHIILHEIEFGGTRHIAEAKHDAFIIGLLPPSYEVWVKRLKKREEVSDEEYMNRLDTAVKVLAQMLAAPYFKFVINDAVEDCAADIRQIVEQGELDSKKQFEARSVAVDILERLEVELNSVKADVS